MALSTSARAAARDDEARAAYDRAAAAYDAKDFVSAATDFALADELAPNPTVMTLALAAALRAELPEVAMNLVLRAEARGVSASMQELVRLSREQFAGRVGYLRASCAPLRSCTINIAGHAVVAGAERAYALGALDVSFSDAGRVSSSSVLITAGQLAELHEPEPTQPTPRVTPVRTPPPAVAVERPRLGPEPGLPRGVFWSGVALSTVLVGATAVSGLDTVQSRRAFLDNRTVDTRDHAQAAVVRTNVLLTATLASTLASALIGIFYTRWHVGARTGSRLPLAAVVVF